MPYAYLKIKSPRGERTAPLTAAPTTVGRHESNRLVIDDHMSSRFHCVIEPKDDSFILRDLQSRNGTLLNGDRVMNATLKSGDVITIGSISLTITIHPAETHKPFEPTRGAPTQQTPAEELDVLEVIEDVETGVNPEEAKKNPVPTLRTTADAMTEKSFAVDAITLIDVRGQPLHAAKEAGAAPAAAGSEVVLLFRLILLICFRSHASDIHLEPRPDDFLLRIRMDGNLIEIAYFTKEVGTRLTALIKVLCQLDTTQRHIVQEGHFAATAPGKEPAPGKPPTPRRVDYRVSFVPSLHGQKLVIRIFDTANAPTLMNDLQLPPKALQLVSEELNKDSGLILVCGPTGSGKTTTLYSLLRSCGSSYRNIVTIEDPVEVQLPGTTQLPVDEANNNTFSSLLRSVLRQDPDVIMVGEIRDSETAKIALQASMTGHLVLSTIHTRDAVGTVFRLLDLGIEPYMVAQGLHLVLAQRLARTLCAACKRPYVPTPEDRQRLGRLGPKIHRIFAPVGCPKCLGTGFYSRRAFFEFLVTSNAFRDKILQNPSISDLHLSLGEDFIRLQDHGYELVALGLTSIDEIDRAVGR